MAAANWREESLAALAERHGIPRTTTRWRGLADDPGIDAVIVGTPNSLHAPQAIACLEAGKHVLVEKPMARTLAEAEAMIAAADRSGAHLMVAHCWRFHPDVRALRRAGGRRRAGRRSSRRVATASTRRGARRAGSSTPSWRAAAPWWTWAFTPSTPLATCSATPNRPAFARRSARRYGDAQVDDDGILLIGWSNGTNSIVESGWWQPHIEGLEADTELYGTGGYARIWDFTEGPEGYEHCSQPMYSAQMAEFIDACLSAASSPAPTAATARS